MKGCDLHTQTAAHLNTWRTLCDKVDAFFQRAHKTYNSDITCHAGCSHCCHPELSIVLLEALAALEGLRQLPPKTRQTLATKKSPPTDTCAFLVDGRCLIYAFRPLICRSHGLPIRQRDPDTNNEFITACDLNFTGDIPAEAVLDGTQVTTTLGIADALLRQHLGNVPPVRIALADIASDGYTVLEKVGLDCCAGK